MPASPAPALLLIKQLHNIIHGKNIDLKGTNLKRNLHSWRLNWYKHVKVFDGWVKRDQLDATCFIITLFSAQHVSDVNTSILRSLRLIRWVTSWVVSGYEVTQRISRKLLRMDVLTSETCWALNKVIIKQVASSWSLFTQLSRWCTVQ